MSFLNSIFGSTSEKDIRRAEKDIYSRKLPSDPGRASRWERQREGIANVSSIPNVSSDTIAGIRFAEDAPAPGQAAPVTRRAGVDSGAASRKAGLGYFDELKPGEARFGDGGVGKYAKAGRVSTVTDPTTGEMYTQVHDFKDTANKAGITGSDTYKSVSNKVDSALGGIGNNKTPGAPIVDRLPGAAKGQDSDAKRIMDVIENVARTVVDGTPGAMDAVSSFVTDQLGAEYIPKIMEVVNSNIDKYRTKYAAKGMEQDEIGRREARQQAMDSDMQSAVDLQDPFAGDDEELAALGSISDQEISGLQDTLGGMDTFGEDLILEDLDGSLNRDLDFADANYDNAQTAAGVRREQNMELYGQPYHPGRLADAMEANYNQKPVYRNKGLVGDIAGVAKGTGELGYGLVKEGAAVVGRGVGRGVERAEDAAVPFLFGDQDPRYNFKQQPSLDGLGMDLGPESYPTQVPEAGNLDLEPAPSGISPDSQAVRDRVLRNNVPKPGPNAPRKEKRNYMNNLIRKQEIVAKLEGRKLSRKQLARIKADAYIEAFERTGNTPIGPGDHARGITDAIF